MTLWCGISEVKIARAFEKLLGWRGIVVITLDDVRFWPSGGMADTQDLKFCVLRGVRVRVPPRSLRFLIIA